jgi:hypothetical protein
VSDGPTGERSANGGASERLVIPVAKGSLARFFAISLAGIAGFAYLLFGRTAGPAPLGPALRALSAVGILFCAFSGLFAARRLFDPTPGLVLDAEGLIDNSSVIGAGRVRWDEITEIRVTKSGPQRFLTVVVEDPRKFIDRGGSLRRKVYEANYRKAGTPVNVTARTLAIPFEDLVAKTSEFYRRYGRSR